jgi:hypothetical protein
MIARSIGNLFNRKFATALVDDQLVIRHVAGINHSLVSSFLCLFRVCFI